MPETTLIIYCEADGTAPVLEWLDRVPARAKAKCRVRMERLRELGHQLRRPETDYLRDDIYELRASSGGVHYRLLYFFHGTTAVVLAHGLTKKREVPARAIERAIERKTAFEQDPEHHSLDASELWPEEETS